MYRKIVPPMVAALFAITVVAQANFSNSTTDGSAARKSGDYSSEKAAEEERPTDEGDSNISSAENDGC